MVKNKTDLRKAKLKIRKELSEYEVKELSNKIFNNLTDSGLLNSVNDVLIYASYNNEVSTFDFVKDHLFTTKNVYYPKVKEDNMDFYRVVSMNDLKPGCMGIPEPEEDSLKKYTNNELSVMLLPLSVFDRHGNRVGYGGGYYDKYLSHNTKFIKVGLAYSFQEYEEIDAEPTDIKLDYIITEKEIIEVNND